MMTHSIEKARDDFPILSQQVKEKPLVYLDSAASAQNPLVSWSVKNSLP